MENEMELYIHARKDNFCHVLWTLRDLSYRNNSQFRENNEVWLPKMLDILIVGGDHSWRRDKNRKILEAESFWLRKGLVCWIHYQDDQGYMIRELHYLFKVGLNRKIVTDHQLYIENYRKALVALNIEMNQNDDFIEMRERKSSIL